jgi:hypothetical protein
MALPELNETKTKIPMYSQHQHSRGTQLLILDLFFIIPSQKKNFEINLTGR